MKRKSVLSVLVLILAVFVVTFSSMSQFAHADAPTSYDGCLAAAGNNREYFNDVQWACRKYSEAPANNVCTVWLGSPDNDSVSTIVVSSLSGTANVNVYGMCTKSANQTNTLDIRNDNDAVSVPSSFNRSGTWGSPSSTTATIDIAKFVQGVTPVQNGDTKIYSRTVVVYRQHGGTASDKDFEQTLSIQVGGSTPDPGNGNCPGIAAPGSYAASTSTNGTSSVRTQVQKNGGGFSNELFVKPGDSVNWRHCYFPGMQKVASQTATVGHNHPTDVTRYGGRTEYANNNALMSAFSPWVNAYNIRYKNGGSNDKYFGFGESDVKRNDNQYSVGQDWVGGSFSETSSLIGSPWSASVRNSNDSPWDCTYTHRGMVTAEGGNVPRIPECQDGYVMKTVCGPNNDQWYHPPGSNISVCPIGTSLVPDTTQPKYKSKCTYETDVTDTLKCKHTNSRITYSKTNYSDKSSETATVRVPYNFTLSSSIKINSDVVYAGETASLTDTKIWASAKSNGVTGGTYRTKSPVVKGQFVTFIARNANGTDRVTSEVGGEIKTKSGGFSYNEGAWSLSNQKVNVNDAQAGLYFCVALKVYPSSSGSDTNWNDADGNHSWGTSGIDCKIIAKRPSLQIWGGNVFSNGKIYTSTARKNNGNGLNYVVDASRTSEEKIYGSWGELGVTVLNTNTGLASGNSLLSDSSGLRVNASKAAQAFCNKESILSFANFMKGGNICNGSSIYTVNGTFGIGRRNVNKQAIIEDLGLSSASTNCGGGVSIANNYFATSNSGANAYNRITSNDTVINALYCNEAINVGASSVGFGQTANGGSIVRDVGTTWVLRSNNDITISGNINYITPSSGYTTFNGMQKLIIYSKKNIKINCAVTNIDAILIAEKEVNTCYNASNDDNDWARNVQLKINGAIIAESMKVGRSFGSGGGVYPAQPAEIINHDTSLILWGRAQADISESNKTYTTYTRELAPRF